MAVDHTRRLPVEPERLEYLSDKLYGCQPTALSKAKLRELYQIAMQAEQLEVSRNIEFFLSEAYEIYNQRFR